MKETPEEILHRLREEYQLVYEGESPQKTFIPQFGNMIHLGEGTSLVEESNQFNFCSGSRKKQ